MSRRRGAFTLVELLVVIGILAVLIGLLLPSLSRARRQAKHTQVTAGLREMLNGYTQYHIDNKGYVLYGYAPPNVKGQPMTVYDPGSGKTYGAPVSCRYPWRLLPYVANLWSIIHIHQEVPPVPLSSDSTSTAFSKAYTLSIAPSFGINAVFVGGQKDYGGFEGDKPVGGERVVFKSSQVKRSSELIVFAECQARIANKAMFDDDWSGLHWLTPPRMSGQRWKAENNKFVITIDGTDTGLPMGRFSDKAAVGFFDGHVESLAPGELEDMRLWSNQATRADWDN